LQSAGDIYIDDIQLVAGSVAESGPNTLANAGFETGSLSPWAIGTDGNNSASAVTSTVKHGGNDSLHLISSSPGTTRNSSIYQDISPALTTGAPYTLSYWYLQSGNGGPLTLRLSGSLILSTVNPAPPGGGTNSARYTPGAPNSVRATLPAFPKLWLNELQPTNSSGPTDHLGHHHRPHARCSANLEQLVGGATEETVVALGSLRRSGFFGRPRGMSISAVEAGASRSSGGATPSPWMPWRATSASPAVSARKVMKVP
jgi:hypothetical protein